MRKSRFLILSAILMQSLLILACIPKPLTIVGNSMSPALKNGDVIYVSVFWDEKIPRGEIVYMMQPEKENTPMVARVVGLPGEEVRFINNQVFIDGTVLSEPYVLPENNRMRLREGTYRVEAGKYFVMGDNRDNSLDSRWFGTIPRDRILARYHSTSKKADEK